MTDELDTLQPEVQRALRVLDDWLPETDMDGKPNVWRTVRAELVRLQNEETALSDLVWRQAKILTGIANALKGEPGRLYAHSHHDLAEVAQSTVAELAALKARIADGPSTQVSRMAAIGGGSYEWAGCRVPDTWNGKRVHLLVEE